MLHNNEEIEDRRRAMEYQLMTLRHPPPPSYGVPVDDT